jgi:hypothetical protein
MDTVLFRFKLPEIAASGSMTLRLERDREEVGKAAPVCSGAIAALHPHGIMSGETIAKLSRNSYFFQGNKFLRIRLIQAIFDCCQSSGVHLRHSERLFEKVFAVMLSIQRSPLAPLQKGGINLKVPLLKGDLGGSPLLLLAKRPLKHLLKRVHPSFARLPSSPSPFSQNGRRGAGFKVPLPPWERDLG